VLVENDLLAIGKKCRKECLLAAGQHRRTMLEAAASPRCSVTVPRESSSIWRKRFTPSESNAAMNGRSIPFLPERKPLKWA
jgi:hypothetical protein